MKETVVIGGASRQVELRQRPEAELEVRIDGEPVAADVTKCGEHTVSVLIDGHAVTLEWDLTERTGLGAVYWLSGRSGDVEAEVRDPRRWNAQQHAEPSGRASLKAPMAGKVVRVLVEVGAAVEAGAGVVVLEAMKMQNEVRTPKGGVLVACHVETGQTVATHQLLAEVE